MINRFFEGRKVFLASNSPRRKQILQETGLEFEVYTRSGVDEDFPEGLSCKDTAEYLALKKSTFYEDMYAEERALIFADTVVCHNSRILNKAQNAAQAEQMLSSLSGSVHSVSTGVCIVLGEERFAFSDTAEIEFYKLSREEIKYYIQNYKPFDKAGAYGIQEWIGYIAVKRLSGSYQTVMGFPIQKFYQTMKSLT